MHVAEQRAEVQACLDETGRRPVELLAEHGVLSDRFVAVHATHITSGEARLLGQAASSVCLCPTTERDLGDGLPNLGAMIDAGVGFCLGVDGYALCDPFEEMRGVEQGERLRTGKRFTTWTAPAEHLWRAASEEGARALGFANAGGYLELRTDAPTLQLVNEDHWLDALVFSGSAQLVERVVRT